MSVGGVSGSGYESMRARFESFRSGQTRIQKSDLDEAKSAMGGKTAETSKSKEAGGSQGIDELIEKFSQIDTNGDGISAEELDAAVKTGTISQSQGPGGGKPAGMKGPPPGGPPPGGAPPGGMAGQQKNGGTSQADLMGYDLFAEFKKKLAGEAAAATGSTEEATAAEETTEAESTAETEAADSLEQITGQETLDLLAMWGKSSSEKSRNGSDDSGPRSKSREMASALVQQLLKAYQQQAGLTSDVSALGSGMMV